MRLLIQTLLVSLAGLLASASSTAVPVDLIVGSGKVPGFSYSMLHSCDDASCMSGSGLGSISGTLTGHLENGVLSDLTGELTVGWPTTTVVDVKGFFDFTPGGVGGELTLDGIGTFSFANALMAGPANSFDGLNLYAWGGIRALQTRGYTMGMDLGGRVVPAVPEPSAALLFGFGALIVGGRIRR